MGECHHSWTSGRPGEKGSWCQDCGEKIYEVETRPCEGCMKYAARCAAYGPIGVQEDGLGLVNERDSAYPRKGDVLVHEISDDCECEIL